MADLRELTTDAKRLYEALDYLLEKQDRANADDIDFKEIWFGAKARPFEHHCIEQLEPEEARSYLLILAGLIALADDADKKKVQIRFLARIIAGYKKSEIQLNNLVNDGFLLQEKNIDELQEIKNLEIKECLLIDLLLMVYLDANIISKQLDYAIGIMAYLGLNREKVVSIGNAVKGILEQNDLLILSQYRDINTSFLACFMKNASDGLFVNDLAKAKEADVRKIIFANQTWERINLNLDEYEASDIVFENCTFKKITRIASLKKKVVFQGCTFEESTGEENIIVLNQGTIDNCIFAGIKTIDTKCKHLFYFKDSTICNSKFVGISIQHNASSPYGGVVKSQNCSYIDTVFKKIETKSSRDSSYRRVFDLAGGIVESCRFEDCTLAKDSYLLTISNEIKKNQISVVNLCSNYSEYNNAYHKNDSDFTIDQVFGVI